MKFLDICGLWLAGLIVFSSCSHEPRDIRLGEEECAHCQMIISEKPFAAQLITDKGRHYVFDAIECMAAHQLTEIEDPETIGSSWVPDMNHPDIWLVAEEAVYLKSSELSSPMSLNLSAYADNERAVEYQTEYGGELFNWEELKKHVQEEWFGNRD